MSSLLFAPVRLADLELANRIVVAPMCQYSADDGSLNDWHLIHLGSLSMSGAGLLFVEATAVEPQGRISAYDSGLYSNENEAAMARVVAACRKWGQTKLGIQLGHAGRKASAEQPWKGGKSVSPDQTGGWPIEAPSAIPFGPGWQTPHELGAKDLSRIRSAFVEATRRAVRLGFDALELHAAHGYLLHQFLSPLSNRRTDQYGGSLENRMRFPLEIFAAMREAWPRGRPFGVRVSATDWIAGGWDLDQTVAFADALKRLGSDFIDVSSGGTDGSVRVPVAPSYQVPFAKEIKQRVGLPTMAVGMISEPEQAEAILARGEADMIAMARAFLDDPRWGWHAAARLGASFAYPVQYERATYKLWPLAKRYLPKAAE